MTKFYFQAAMTKPSGHYWNIGLDLEAEGYTEALRIFKAWGNGVRAVSSLTPHLCNFGDKATKPDRSYFNMNSAKTILAELTTFMNENHTKELLDKADERKELVDKLIESQRQSLDEDTHKPDPDMVTERPSTDDACPF